MGQGTQIAWADDTFNPWWGCKELSPACDHCYAKKWAARFDVGWGAYAQRRFFGETHWQEPVKWNRQAEKAGKRRRVFCASMADWAETLPQGHPQIMQMELDRMRLFALIERTRWLDWLLLTKRIESCARLVPDRWNAEGWPLNVWLGTTVEGPKWAERRVPELLAIPAAVHFVSYEPALGPVLWHDRWLRGYEPGPKSAMDAKPAARIDWLICGGESGDKPEEVRPMHPDWARLARDQARKFRTAYFFKQWGSWGVEEDSPLAVIVPGQQSKVVVKYLPGDSTTAFRWSKHKSVNGDLLDGLRWQQVPVSPAAVAGWGGEV